MSTLAAANSRKTNRTSSIVEHLKTLACTACWTAQAQEEAVQVQAQISLYKHLRTGRGLRQRDGREGWAVRLCWHCSMVMYPLPVGFQNDFAFCHARNPRLAASLGDSILAVQSRRSGAAVHPAAGRSAKGPRYVGWGPEPRQARATRKPRHMLLSGAQVRHVMVKSPSKGFTTRRRAISMPSATLLLSRLSSGRR